MYVLYIFLYIYNVVNLNTIMSVACFTPSCLLFPTVGWHWWKWNSGLWGVRHCLPAPEESQQRGTPGQSIQLLWQGWEWLYWSWGTERSFRWGWSRSKWASNLGNHLWCWQGQGQFLISIISCISWLSGLNHKNIVYKSWSNALNQ